MDIRSTLTLITVSIPGASGPKSWHWILFLAVVLALAALIVPAILTWQRSRRRQVVRLELANQGNVRSRYALHASEPAGQLAFRFLLNGAPLPDYAVTHAMVAPEPQPVPVATAVPAPPARNVQQTLAGTAQTGGVVAGLLSTLGRLLPSSLGKPLLDISADMRRGQQMAAQAKQASQYAQRLQPQPKSTARPSSSQRAVPAPVAIEIWSQTQVVEPNQRAFIDLSITPTRPYRTGYFTYALTSRSIDHKEAPTTMESYGIQLDPLSPFDRFAPFMIFAVGLILLLILFLSLW